MLRVHSFYPLAVTSKAIIREHLPEQNHHRTKLKYTSLADTESVLKLTALPNEAWMNYLCLLEGKSPRVSLKE